MLMTRAEQKSDAGNNKVIAELPRVQARQAKLLEACGFACKPAGEMLIGGAPIAMQRATGERSGAVADLIGYGGAAYGGKTFGNLILARVAATLWPGIQIAFFRRTYSQLDGPGAAMQTAHEVFNGAAKASDGGKEWKFDNGSVFYFRYAQNEKDKYNYQSQQIDVLILDEATHFTWSIVDYLLTRNRATTGAYGFKPFAVMPSNPGNIGHVWYSQIFDVEKKQGEHERVKTVLNPNGRNSSVYFIPALLEDNQIGVSRDPGYEGRLMERDPEVARALRYGDWTVFAGQAFAGWTKARVMCEPFDIPEHWPRWRALDYGYVHPFTAGWFAMDPRTRRVYVYRAILQSGLTDVEQARVVKQLTGSDERPAVTYASPDMWARKSAGEKVFTSVDEYKAEGVTLQRADDDRLGGKRKLDRLLADQADGMPGLMIFAPYYKVFKCMETLVRSERNLEDVEKVDGDDAYDMLRYGLTNLDPPVRRAPEEVKKRQVNPMRNINSL